MLTPGGNVVYILKQDVFWGEGRRFWEPGRIGGSRGTGGEGGNGGRWEKKEEKGGS